MTILDALGWVVLVVAVVAWWRSDVTLSEVLAWFMLATLGGLVAWAGLTAVTPLSGEPHVAVLLALGSVVVVVVTIAVFLAVEAVRSVRHDK